MVKAKTPRVRAGRNAQGTPARVRRSSSPGEAPTQPAPPSSPPLAASPAPGAPPTAPVDGDRASVRIYRQGLGDCILIRLKRPGIDDYKILIDCGVVLGTHDPAPIMQKVVEDVVAVTGGAIDVLAITHEHWDHLSGFNQATESFKKLKVGAVWVAWTENPDDGLANDLKSQLGRAEQAVAASAERLHGFGAQDMADLLPDLAATTLGLTGGAAGGNSTKAAFDFAKSMASPNHYLEPAQDPIPISGMDARVYVLGPPHDKTQIRKINPTASAPETYALALSGGGVMPFGVASALNLQDTGDGAVPFHWRSVIPTDVARNIDFFKNTYFEGEDWRRIDGDWLGPSADLALALQSYTNNTSLVLAIELGVAGSGDVLLFAGDAQVGNWESWQDCAWPQTNPTVTGPGLLARTVFYKVGHHGSHNATLKAHGVEEMKALKAAVIPVDEAMAVKKRWGHMPLPLLLDALSAKLPKGPVLRTDKTPTVTYDRVTVTDLYFELGF